MDYTGSINHMRFDMLGSPIYATVAKEITALLASKAIDPHDVNEIVYIGGTSFFFFQVSFQSKYVFVQTGKNGLGFRVFYHV